MWEPNYVGLLQVHNQLDISILRIRYFQINIFLIFRKLQLKMVSREHCRPTNTFRMKTEWKQSECINILSKLFLLIKIRIVNLKYKIDLYKLVRRSDSVTHSTRKKNLFPYLSKGSLYSTRVFGENSFLIGYVPDNEIYRFK